MTRVCSAWFRTNPVVPSSFAFTSFAGVILVLATWMRLDESFLFPIADYLSPFPCPLRLFSSTLYSLFVRVLSLSSECNNRCLESWDRPD